MKIIEEFILREIAGEIILIPTGETTQRFNGLITLTDTAKFIWEHIEQVDSLQEMVSAMREEYEIDEETATKDTIEFVTHLLNVGFIECTKEDKTW